MNASSVDVKDMLVADTPLGLVFAINLFVGSVPTHPIDSVTIFDSPGYPNGLTLDGNAYEYPSIQIMIKNKSYVAAYDLGKSIVDSLHGRAQETWNDTLYSVITCSNGPYFLMWDDNRRAVFVINFNIQRR